MSAEHDHRATAADWHGGQWSPLYAFASSGTVLPGAAAEARGNLRHAETDEDRAALIALAEHLAEHEPTEDDDEPEDEHLARHRRTFGPLAIF